VTADENPASGEGGKKKRGPSPWLTRGKEKELQSCMKKASAGEGKKREVPLPMEKRKGKEGLVYLKGGGRSPTEKLSPFRGGEGEEAAPFLARKTGSALKKGKKGKTLLPVPSTKERKKRSGGEKKGGGDFLCGMKRKSLY